MRSATFPAPPSRAPRAVAFASASAVLPDALTEGERREYDALPRAHGARRRDWLAGRCAARQAVADHSGVPVERLQLVSRTGAAPACMVLDGERWTPLSVSLSIAHRDGVAIAAAADSATRVGVDIERPGEIAPEHRRYFLTPSERCVDSSLAWVLKEAAWKALGVGPAVPFTDMELAFDRASHALRGVRLDDTWIPAHADVVRLSHPRPLIAAVLALGDIGTIAGNGRELS